MIVRVLIGALLLGLLAGVYLLDTHVLEGALATRLLLWTLLLGALREVLRLASARIECGPGLFPTGAVAVIVVLIPALIEGKPVSAPLMVLAAALAGGIRLLSMARVKSAPVAFPEAAALWAALVFVCGLGTFLDRIAVENLVAAYVVVGVSKSSDVFAYLAGSLFGKHPMAPSLSPGKTWEGAVAGLLGAACVAALFPVALSGQNMPPAFAAGVGLLLGGASMVGDLVASGLKRWAGVKDSSAFLPQFGGILDLVDGVLLAAPVAVVCLFGS
ncbi:MAG: phosphatidate cytidylyltransferase [Planctomycetota bacterium]|nr:phosphatidate cytidylyltransferase [Planctomycetota bacterium]